MTERAGTWNENEEAQDKESCRLDGRTWKAHMGAGSFPELS